MSSRSTTNISTRCNNPNTKYTQPGESVVILNGTIIVVRCSLGELNRSDKVEPSNDTPTATFIAREGVVYWWKLGHNVLVSLAFAKKHISGARNNRWDPKHSVLWWLSVTRGRFSGVFCVVAGAKFTMFWWLAMAREG